MMGIVSCCQLQAMVFRGVIKGVSGAGEGRRVGCPKHKGCGMSVSFVHMLGREGHVAEETA